MRSRARGHQYMGKDRRQSTGRAKCLSVGSVEIRLGPEISL